MGRMHKPLLFVAGCFVMLGLMGCPDKDDAVVRPPVQPPTTQVITPPNPPDTTTQWEEKIRKAEKDRADAIAKADRLAQLQAEKDEAQYRASRHDMVLRRCTKASFLPSELQDGWRGF